MKNVMQPMRFVPAAFVLLVLAAAAQADYTSIAYWKFDDPNDSLSNHNTPADNFMIVDSTGNQNHLQSYQSGGTNDYVASGDLPAADLFAGPNAASAIPEFDPNAILVYEVPFHGNDFNLAGQSFTLEGYFKTSNTTDRQDVIFNAQSNFSYLINLNEQTSGELRFATGPGPYPQVNLSNGGAGYADGNWYGFVATYQEKGPGQQDVLSLTTYNNTGDVIETGSFLAPVGFNIQPTTQNLGIGTSIFANPFDGNLDEIRISRGLVQTAWRLSNVTGVYNDTFDNTHDYKTDGVAGTMWDGIVNGTGAASTFATSNGPTATGDGDLQLDIAAGAAVGFDSDRANAPFMFKTVAADEAFDVQIVIDSTTHASYSVLGLMVRDAADGLTGGAANADEDYISLNYDNFGAPKINIRSSDDGSVTNPLTNQPFERYLRIVREYDQFSFYSRALDTDNWDLLYTLTRSDLTGEVQVGFWYGLFGNAGTSPAGSAQIENFLLITTTIPTPAALPAGLALLTLATMRRRR
jgi:hypothetical protein